MRAGLSDAGTYFTRQTGVLDFAKFHQSRRSQYADNLRIRSRMDAWKWITGEIKGDIENGERMHADSLGAIADVSLAPCT